MASSRVVEHAQQRRGSAARTLRQSRDVDVIGPAIFQREANEFAAALDGRPVIQFVTHDRSPCSEGIGALSVTLHRHPGLGDRNPIAKWARELRGLSGGNAA